MTKLRKEIQDIVEAHPALENATMRDTIKLVDELEKSLALPHVIGTSNDLPTGTYTVGVDVAEEGINDFSCKTWMQEQNGKIVVVKVEHYL